MKRLFVLPSALAINWGLFALMQGLVVREPDALPPTTAPLTLAVVRAELPPTPPDEVEPEREPQAVQEEEAPASPAMPLTLAAVAPPAQVSSPTAPALGMPFELKGKFRLGELVSGASVGTGRGVKVAAQVTPAVRVAPIYPADAEREGIEGFVVVQFDILQDGSVDDLAIVKAQPADVFERAVAQAVRQWKFPRSSTVRRQRERIDFELEQTL